MLSLSKHGEGFFSSLLGAFEGPKWPVMMTPEGITVNGDVATFRTLRRPAPRDTGEQNPRKGNKVREVATSPFPLCAAASGLTPHSLAL